MKLYVGNLPWSVDDRALKEMFTSYGDISEAVLIKDKFSGRSKGFGFVTFAKDDDAKKAISEMHEKDIEGRPLTVSEARPMVPRDNSQMRNHSHDEPSEAPMADSSQINNNVEKDEAMDSYEDAKDDAATDEPATEEAVAAEESSENKEN